MSVTVDGADILLDPDSYGVDRVLGHAATNSSDDDRIFIRDLYGRTASNRELHVKAHAIAGKIHDGCVDGFTASRPRMPS